MIFTTDGRPEFSPAWASGAIWVAAALVLLERFFGSPTGWMRFIRTEMHLRQLHQEFEMDWSAASSNWSRSLSIRLWMRSVAIGQRPPSVMVARAAAGRGGVDEASSAAQPSNRLQQAFVLPSEVGDR